MAVSVHTIAFKGAAGASFILLMVASIFYVLAVGSSAWSRGDKDEVTGLYGQQGLWQSCQCLSDSSLSPGRFNIQDLICGEIAIKMDLEDFLKCIQTKFSTA